MIHALLLSLFSLAAAAEQPDLVALAQKRNYDGLRSALEAGAEVDIINESGATALIIASTIGDTQMVRLLLDYGADVNARRPEFWTALMTACDQNTQVIDLLLQAGADVLAETREGETAASLVFQSASFDLIMRAVRFALDPLASLAADETNRKESLLWSIALKKHECYQQIRKLHPEWFAKPTLLARLFLHAARTSNLEVATELFKKLQLVMPRKKLRQIVLQAFFFLSRHTQMADFIHQIAAEIIIPDVN